MDLNYITSMLAEMKDNVSPVTVTLLILFIASEVIGTKESVKASSLYGVLKAILQTVKDQVWPKAKPVSTPADPQGPTIPPAV